MDEKEMKERLYALLKNLTGSSFEEFDGEDRVRAYSLYFYTLSFFACASFYNLLLVCIFVPLQALTLISASFPIYFCAFISSFLGAILRFIIAGVANEQRDN